MHPTFPATFDGLLALCAYLRSEDGCPWDAEQTHESLKPMLLEEMYELIDAVDQSDSSGIVEELGDLLYHLILVCLFVYLFLILRLYLLRCF